VNSPLHSAPYLAFGAFVIDVRQRHLLRREGGTPLTLTSKVFDTLLCLVREPGVTLDKGRLMRAIWGDLVVEDNNLTQNISALRHALGEAPGSNQYIVTVPRLGYRFVAQVVGLEATPIEDAPAQPAPPAEVLATPPVTAQQEFAVEPAAPTPSAPGAVDAAHAPVRRSWLWVTWAAVALAIVLMAGLWLAPETRDESTHAPPHEGSSDPETERLFANGRLAWSRYDERGLEQAIGYFNQVIERDPRHAQAYSGLADAYAILGVFGFRAPHDVYPPARRAAERALSLDPNLAAAHATLGHIRIQYDLDWKGGLAHYARAEVLDPNYAPTYHRRGLVLAMHGRIEEALANLQRAQQLEPLMVASRAATGNVLYYARRYDEAIAVLTEALALDERADNARTYRARAYLHTGKVELALAEFRKRRSAAPGSQGDIGQALAMAGRREEARAELARLIALSHERHVQALDIATVNASLGNDSETLDWLARAFDDRSTNLGFLGQDPTFDKLRTHPRFIALLERIGVKEGAG
jgi:DNA-binding winged helix-turn-helix (wHTH) protein/Tfp pilus assembly protein PilF